MLLMAIKVLIKAINYSKVINDTIDAVYQVQSENLNVIASTMFPLSLSSIIIKTKENYQMFFNQLKLICYIQLVESYKSMSNVTICYSSLKKSK